jgi:Tfp pilus assembly major pilin PilA
MGESMQNKYRQQGVSLTGLIFVLAILAMLGILGLKIVPTITEFNAVKNAVTTAKSSGTAAEIRKSFDKQADVAYITALKGEDLEIKKIDNDFEVSFAYDKKIPLVGPASLLIEYAGTTAKNKSSKKVVE